MIKWNGPTTWGELKWTWGETASPEHNDRASTTPATDEMILLLEYPADGGFIALTSANHMGGTSDEFEAIHPDQPFTRWAVVPVADAIAALELTR